MQSIRNTILFFFALSLFAVPLSGTNAPTNLVATATSHNQVSLTWTDNSTDEIGFTFQYDTSPSFTNPQFVWTGGPGTTSFTHTNRSTATTYFYKIKAEGNPDSSWTSVDSATTAPSSLSATASSASQIDLAWSGNASNPNIHGYTIARATNSSFTNASYQFVYGAGTTAYSSTGLTAGTTYYFKVKAEGTNSNDAYDSPFTGSVSATTPSGAPNAPSNLIATVVSSSRIDLSWTDNSTNETAFELKRATDSAFTQNVVWIGGIQGTTYSNTGLTAATTYYYKVRAKGSVQDSVYSTSVSATTQSSGVPAAPSNLSGTAVSSSRINLSWTDNSSDETGFELKRATDSAFTQNVVWRGGIQGTSYGDVGLAPSTTYWYKIRAEGTAGKSSYSNTISVITQSSTPVTEGIPISPRFFGQNAWMPQYVGDENYNGKLAANWTNVQQSHARSVRYGGIAADREGPKYVEGDPPPADVCPPDMAKQGSKMQYVTVINAMKDIDVVPIIQVPVWANQWDENDAKALVQCINGTMGLGVKYWSIGNEPDLKYSGFDAADVAEYVRRFSRAMKDADPTIKIVAPETSWFQWNNFLDPLTNGGANDITGRDSSTDPWWVDVISFHAYPYGNSFPDRNGVISATTNISNNLQTLKNRIAQRNTALGRTGDNALTIAITEANINFDNPSYDNIDSVGAVSFLGGQFWADLLGVAMQHGVDFVNFWSIIEGGNVVQDKGYLCNKPELGHEWAHPSYHHFKMMAEHFRGNALLPPSPATQFDNQTNVKTFAAKDTDQVAVILINQDGATDFSYAVSLNGSASGGTLQVNIPANISATQSTGTLYKQSTILLVFDNTGALQKKVEYRRFGPSGTPWLNTTP